MPAYSSFWSKLLVLPLAVNLALATRCPSPELTTAVDEPTTAAIKNPTCPGDNGKVVEGPDGHYFTLLCCQHESTGSEFIRTVPGTGPQDCMQKCLDADPECNSFRWLSEGSGSCMLYKKGGFVAKASVCSVETHDWYYITDPPAQEAFQDQTVLCSTECPTANGQKYISEFGELFHMECGRRHGTETFRQDIQNTYRDCIDACAAIPKCSSVDFSNRTSTCYYGTHSGAAPVDAPGYFSAYSLGCAGACDKGDEGCCCGSSCDKKTEL